MFTVHTSTDAPRDPLADLDQHADVVPFHVGSARIDVAVFEATRSVRRFRTWIEARGGEYVGRGRVTMHDGKRAQHTFEATPEVAAQVAAAGYDVAYAGTCWLADVLGNGCHVYGARRVRGCFVDGYEPPPVVPLTPKQEREREQLIELISEVVAEQAAHRLAVAEGRHLQIVDRTHD